MQMTNNSSRVR
jgi:hypothetical protein